MFTPLDKKVAFIKNVFGGADPDRRYKDVYVRCPFCDPKTGKRKLVIRVEDSLTHCWVCGYSSRTLGPILRKFYRDALPEFGRIYPRDAKKWCDPSEETGEEVHDNTLRLPRDWTPLALADYDDLSVKAALRYLVSRGLRGEDIWRWKVGISDTPQFAGKVIFPSHDYSGELNYYIGRSYQHDGFGKYYACKVNTVDIIFNEYWVDWTQRLKICEGPFDAVKCGGNVVPLIGSGFYTNSLLFDRIVTNGTPVLLALDPDVTKKTEKYVKLLESYEIDVIVADTSKSDPGAMTHEEWAKVERRAAHMTWDQIFTNRLQRALR